MKRYSLVFLAALLPAAVLGFSFSASAAFRLAHASACTVTSIHGATCPVNTGDDFLLNQINSAFVDAHVKASACGGNAALSVTACRLNFATGVASCGPAVTQTAGSGDANLDVGANVSAWTAGSNFDDYAFLSVSDASFTFSPPCPESQMTMIGTFVTTP